MKKITFFLIILLGYNSLSQSKKIPKTIKLDYINKGYVNSSYRISLNFYYNKENQLIKVIDSYKVRKKIFLRKLHLFYNQNGKLKEYSYERNNTTNGHKIVYNDNKILMTPYSESEFYHILETDKSEKVFKIKNIYKPNSLLDETLNLSYYENGNLKTVGNINYKYSEDKGIFADVKMESWVRHFFGKLLKVDFEKNNIISKSEKLSHRKFEYEIEDHYPSKQILKDIITYKVIYLNKNNE